MAVMGAAGGDWNPEGAQGAVNAVRAFWESIRLWLPNELTLTVSPVVDSYDRATGALIASHIAATAPVVVTGDGSGNYAAGAGLKIAWETGQIRDGRRVKGTTYLVPAVNVFTATGTIDATPKAQINTACATLLAALDTAVTPMAVWSRPRPVSETLPARAGAAFEVSAGICSNKSAILRGRRD